MQQILDGDAVTLCLKMTEMVKACNEAVAADMKVNGAPLFYYVMPDTNNRHILLIKRKHNMVKTIFINTLYACRQLKMRGKTTSGKLGARMGWISDHSRRYEVIGFVACLMLFHKDNYQLLEEFISEMVGIDLNAK